MQREIEDITALITHVGAAAPLGKSSGAVPARKAVLGGAPITNSSYHDPRRRTATGSGGPDEDLADVAALRAVAHTISYDSRVMGDTQGGEPATLHRFAPIDLPVLALAGGQCPAHQRDAVVALCSILPTRS